MTKRALIFILYHPATLTLYDQLCEVDLDRSLRILAICGHPHVNKEIIDHYRVKYDHIINLPHVKYEKNIFAGLLKYHNYMTIFKKEVHPILKNCTNFNVISDCSAYLPVNALISNLRKDRKFKNLISTQTHDIHDKTCLLQTMHTLFYTFTLGLQHVYFDKTYSYLYYKEPYDKVIFLVSPYRKFISNIYSKKTAIPFHLIHHAYKTSKNNDYRNIIIFYSDMNLQDFHNLSNQEFEERFKNFLLALYEHYNNCRIICKPHPVDDGRLMNAFESIQYELYKGQLTSQVHLDLHLNHIKACYSITSTSLLYSAAMGIPSYTCYKYMDFNGSYPGSIFESEEVRQDPFIYNIQSLNEIGVIDNIKVKPVSDDCESNWDSILQ